MNYLLIYFGEKPRYIRYCINSILSVDSDAKIYFCSDKSVKYKNVEYINSIDVSSDLTKNIEEIDIYKNTNYEASPLWKTSLLRVFYLYDISKSLDLSSFIHFDTDVLIYKPYSKLLNSFDKGRFNVTPLNEDELIFGYSYSNNLPTYKKIIESISDLIVNKKIDLKEPLNEMKILNKVFKQNKDWFNLLTIIPEGSDLIFDPASYGQYIGGIEGKPRKIFRKPWAGDHHYVGREIINKNIKVKYKNNTPYVLKNNLKYDLVNLHVHSKNLAKYLPKDYKEYC